MAQGLSGTLSCNPALGEMGEASVLLREMREVSVLLREMGEFS